ncbi:ARM repeat-containing protein [Eremomyces bilateralis CBS 781.70]|uniref:ARM repeat-containing protein n=1 Tax=Eremomyces bilateralis CBS 781.70 TaxID=1392243 RepID=A0A6G1G5G6_9PEZI|nr:ARM repeat-containing protein [Eremomyces bilateralis CBS 781.70]KAF1813335.1 ARM repeat-containing protein [Eremomyces bilateralis CBS 781.70]
MALAAPEDLVPILSAVDTLQTNADRAEKGQAHEFLDQFQKTQDAWNTAFSILQNADISVQAKMFAAVTLKGKIVYDIHQIPRDTLPSLRDSLLQALVGYRAGPKPIRTLLCVCLANLAIQMTEWKDVLPLVINSLGKDQESIPCVLEFLHVLPEEVTEGRKVNLSEEELDQRTKELLENNASHVLELLSSYAQSSKSAARNPQLMECITSWSMEVPILDIANSPLLETVFASLEDEENSEAFDQAVECICSIFRETKDVDASLDVINILFPRTVKLKPKIKLAADQEDGELMKGITRVFAEAGENWVVLIARHPKEFRELVECILECAVRDREKDAINSTFIFWYELKQLLTMEKYDEARRGYSDIYSNLVDIMISHLQYPAGEGTSNDDLFDGDREAEDKFREFRHQMGDVLKDCCSVIGATECLQKSFILIQQWISTYGSKTTATEVPHWQELEAPLFSFRAMGRMVSPEENEVLPHLMPLLVQIPDHEKVRFQAVMSLGRYTEWTAQHPETLEPQLNYIMAAFENKSVEVCRAAALSFKFFCSDCADLLKPFVPQLQPFYQNALPRLSDSAQEEVTEGVAAIIGRLPPTEIYEAMKLYCDPLMKTYMELAQTASTDKEKTHLADKLALICIFVEIVHPYIEPGQPHPAVRYCQEIFPILAAIADNFVECSPIVERICRCWRSMVLSYRTAMAPLLPDLANKLSSAFASSKQSGLLWATDAIVREFSDGQDDVDEATLNAIFQFYEAQAKTFLQTLSDLSREQMGDVIEDFFRLTSDVLLYHTYRVLPSPLMPTIIAAASDALNLLKMEPIMAVLHCLRDFLAYGRAEPPTSTLSFGHDSYEHRVNPPEVRQKVADILTNLGEGLTQRVLIGMMFSFPSDCIPDASGVLLGLFQVVPAPASQWVAKTLQLLPAGSVREAEATKLMKGIEEKLAGGDGDVRRIRALLQDFTNSYRRRNVAPREGLGSLEGKRFKFG